MTRRCIAALGIVVALVAGACKKSDDAATPAPAPTATDDGGATTVPPTTPAATDAAAAAAPVPPPAPKFPPLGAPPVGMDAALAAACDTGDGKACYEAALGYSPKGAYRVQLSKEEGDAREAGAAKWGWRACQLDHADGCALAVRFLKTAEEQREAGARACALGHMGVCGDIGWSMATKEGIEMLEKACRGNGIGIMGSLPGAYCDWLATRLKGEDDDKPFKDLAKAKEVKALGCQQGYKVGCPCKEDEECGELDGYEMFCFEDVCTAPSAD